MKTKNALILLPLVLTVSSCAAINKVGYQVNRVLKKPHKTVVATTAHEKKSMQQQKHFESEVLKIDSWALYPDKAFSGEKVTSKIKLTAFTTQPDSGVELKVSRSLIMGKETIQFGKPKIEQRNAGEIELSWNFTLPVDADSGEYILVTKVDNGDLSEQVKSRFLVQ